MPDQQNIQPNTQIPQAPVQPMDQTQTSVNTQQTPANLLASIIRGETVDNAIAPMIVSGNKMSNKSLRLYILKLQQDLGFTDGQILDLLVIIDESIEKGIWDNKFFEEVKNNPDILKEIK